jgi:hypothetical protein
MKKSAVSKTSSLAAKALLVHVNISQWTGRRTDKKATATVEKTHKTSAEAGKYTKRLLPGAKELEAVGTVSSTMRKYFYENTLPWLSDGSRIISGKHHMEFSKEMRNLVAEFDKATRDFCAAYPALQAAAQKQLGSLYQVAEYPNPAEIREKFKAEFSFLPLPDVKDFRVEVSEGEKRDFQEKMKQVEVAATRSVAERLHGVVKAAVEKLSDPEAIFRDSLVANIGELCALLPALNISDDPKLEAARRDLEKFVKGNSADSLRADKTVRKDASKVLKDVEDKMAAFMGGKK